MKAILAGCLLLCSLFAYADKAITMTVDSSKQQFVVTLPSNPTTGYQWTVASYNKKIFKMTGSQFIAPRTRLMGAGGQMTFTFALNKGQSYPKSTQFHFTYARSWDKNSGTPTHVTVNFVNQVMN